MGKRIIKDPPKKPDSILIKDINKAIERVDNMTDYEIFQAEFRRWQDKFGLIGWKVYFKNEPLEGSFANIYIDNDNRVAKVTWNREIEEDEIINKDPVNSAKHEAIHLLVSDLEYCGKCRYLNPDDIYRAGEELVRKLEVLIK